MNDQLNWEKLRIYGKNRFVISSSIFLFITPVIYKVKRFVEQSTSTYLNTEIELSFPFTWQLLFIASIIFGLATLLYRIFSPEIIYKYKNLGDYKIAGKYISQLNGYINQIEPIDYLTQYMELELIEKNKFKGKLPDNYKTKTPISDKIKFNKIFSIYSGFYWLNSLQFNRVADNLEKTKYKRLLIENHFTNLFYEIYSYANSTKPYTRYLIAFLFFIGTVLVGYTVIENIIFVLNQFLT